MYNIHSDNRSMVKISNLIIVIIIIAIIIAGVFFFLPQDLKSREECMFKLYKTLSSYTLLECGQPLQYTGSNSVLPQY